MGRRGCSLLAICVLLVVCPALARAGKSGPPGNGRNAVSGQQPVRVTPQRRLIPMWFARVKCKVPAGQQVVAPKVGPRQPVRHRRAKAALATCLVPLMLAGAAPKGFSQTQVFDALKTTKSFTLVETKLPPAGSLSARLAEMMPASVKTEAGQTVKFVLPDPASAKAGDVAQVTLPSLQVKDLVGSGKTKGQKLGDGLFKGMLVTGVALNVADYLSTKEALKYPGLEEGNPLMKPFVNNDVAFAAIKLGTTALNYYSFNKLYKRNKVLGWVLATGTNVILGMALANNLNQISQAKAATVTAAR